MGHEGATVCRVSLLYGPVLMGEGGFFQQQVESLKRGEKLKLFSDEFRTPLALDDAAAGLVRVVDSEARGTLHLGGPERLSRHQMGLRLAEPLGLKPELVTPTRQNSVSLPEPRPRDVSLLSDRAKGVVGWSPSFYRDGLIRLIGPSRGPTR